MDMWRGMKVEVSLHLFAMNGFSLFGPINWNAATLTTKSKGGTEFMIFISSD
jgi:hypothetical protein